jgi:16S rRNA (guanine527-N7)-methyltransferase
MTTHPAEEDPSRAPGPGDPTPADAGKTGAVPGGSEAMAGGPAEGPAVGPAGNAEAEEEGLEGRPDTPVPEHEVLLEALQWAFQGEEIEPPVLERFARHARLMLAANREVNLTAIVDPREIAAKHYLDSWRVTRLMLLSGKRIFDLGSGAGFPGLPVALAEPDTKVTVCDSIQKRASFLERCVQELAIRNAKALCERAEDHLARNKYDVVLIRAVSSVRENVRTLRKVRHSLKDLVMLKGPSWSREVRAGEREAERLGFKLDTVWEHKLPGEMGDRAILVYRAPGSQGG